MQAHRLIARSVFVSALALAAGAALADDMTRAPEMDRIATNSRTTVQAEVLQARRSGTLAPAGEAGLKEAITPPSALSRDEVRADGRKASSRTLAELYLPA